MFNFKKYTMWDNISNLISMASIIQWISIVMILLGGILQIGKLFVDRRIDHLKETDQQRKEIVRRKTEESLNDQIHTLNSNLNERKSEIEDIKKKTEFVDPYTQPIQTASATVFVIAKSNVIFKSDEAPYTWHRDEGVYLAFVKGVNEMILLSAQECRSSFISSDRVKYEGVLSLDANHSSIGKKLTFLKEAEYLRIQFLPIVKDYDVIEGKVVCVFNGNARIEFNIPMQSSKDKLIFVRNISGNLNTVFK